ncbi:TPA: hypothetical protein ACW6D3_003205 [Legionella pneumophila]
MLQNKTNNSLQYSIKLLRSLSGQENCYTIPKLYVQLTQCHVRALILNQLIFYSDKSTRHDDGWFYKTYDDWYKETFVKERTLRNIIKEFKQKNWCESRIELVNGKTTLMCRPLLENILTDIQEILEESTTGKIFLRVRQNFPILYIQINTQINTQINIFPILTNQGKMKIFFQILKMRIVR